MANLSDKVQTFNSFVADNLTDWESFTPAFIGDDNCNLNATLSIFRRIGDSIEIILEAAPTGAGSASTDIFLELPNNLNGSAAAGAYLGPGYFRKDAATNELIPLNVLQSTNTRRIQFLANFPNRAGEGALEDRDFSNVSSSNLGDFIRLRATIPVTEYAGAQSALVGFAEASETVSGLVTTGAQTFAGDKTFKNNIEFAASATNGRIIRQDQDQLLLLSGGNATNDGANITMYGSTNAQADVFRIRQGGTERFRVDTGGNVGIGTTSPTADLHVRSNSGAGFLRVDAPSGQDAYLLLSNNAITRWRMFNDASLSNRLTIQDSSGGASGVYMDQNDTSWTGFSDERFKTEWQELSGSLAKVNTLRAGTYKFTDDPAEMAKKRVGLIAQDVQAVLPEACNDNDPEKLGVRYTEIIPLLTKAIQELSAKLDETKAEKDALEARVTALETP